MERGECMFVDKARHMQKAGAVGAIIVDNVVGSSAETSPMFSMSGDGVDDVFIPTVFLFHQEANQLLTSIIKDPTTEVMISEYKAASTQLASGEDESMFQKIKLSVQEFLNRHTSMMFSNTYSAGEFKAMYLGPDKIWVMYKPMLETTPIFQETFIVPYWVELRKHLLDLLLESETKELIIPTKILQLCQHYIRGDSTLNLAQWITYELAVEHCKDKRKVPVVIKPSTSTSAYYALLYETILKDFYKIESDSKIPQLSSIFEALNEINEMKIQKNDDLVVQDSASDKVILTQEQLETEKSGKDEITTNKKRTSDEL